MRGGKEEKKGNIGGKREMTGKRREKTDHLLKRVKMRGK